MLQFIRSDLAQLTAYSTHHTDNSAVHLDRLDVNENPYDLPEELKEKLAWTWQQQIESNRYPDGGYLALKEAIADYATDSSNANFAAANISVGNGSDELIRSLLIATCLNGEGSILVANPTFSMYGILAKTLGIPVVTIARSPDTFEIDLTAAQAAIIDTQQPPIRVVFVVHPNSPTGNALTEAEITWLRSLPQHILIVIDEAYFEFSQTTLADELVQHPNWVVLRTFSKAFRLAAHRVGYAIAHPDLITTLETVRLPYNLPSFTISAAQFALSERQHLLAIVDVLLTERRKLIAELSKHKQLRLWNSDANFIHIRLQNVNEADSKLEAIYRSLKQQGTLIRYTGGGLRLTVGTPDENQRTCDRMKQALVEML
ncbi:MAG: histidinol-phosphate transaminase [Myxacorys californica WJT36-NPBG1]|jgi:histidinol-phosphate aminotransferase|nr:histidinol-phosphate transaminase [Myxacorys californica WJT36-NPBG1]